MIPTLTVRDTGVKASLQGLPRVIRKGAASALTKTIRMAQTAANREVASLYTVPIREMGRQTTVRAATANRLVATMTARSTRKERAGRIPLSEFKILAWSARARTGGTGVRVQVEKGKAPLVLRHAFVVTFASGHRAIVERVYGRKGARLPGKGWFKGGPPKRGEAIYVGKKGFGRSALPIVEVFGPSVVSMYAKPTVFEVIKRVVAENYARLLEHEVSFAVARGK